jgi:ABC-type sugar transport system substrate-binding protein/archaellum component FlaC
MTSFKMKSIYGKDNAFLAGLIGLGLLTVFLFLRMLFVSFKGPPIPWAAMAGLFCCFIFLAVFIAVTTRSRFLPMRRMFTGAKDIEKDGFSLKQALSQLSKGDFTQRLSVTSSPLSDTPDENLAQINNLLNEIMDGLRRVSAEFNTITDVPCQRLFYVGANRFSEGTRCGEIMGRLLNGKGEVAVNISSFLNTGHVMRLKGFRNYLENHCPDIKIVDVVESKEDVTLTYQHVQKCIQSNPQFNGYYLTQGATPFAAAQAVVDAGRSGKVAIITHDMNENTVFYLKQGVIQATLGQNPMLQGYNAVIHLYNHLATGWLPTTPLLYTPLNVVTPDNYREFWEDREGEIQSPESFQKMAKVMKKQSGSSLWIAVVGRENSPFWIPIKKGIFQAANKLKRYGVKVDWIVPENSQKGSDIRASIYGPLLESLAAKKVNGIAVVAADRNLIPYINRVVKSGVPVVTFNVDPENLLGMLSMVHGQSLNVKNASRKLTETMQTIARSTGSIEREMSDLDKRTSDQNAQIQTMRKSLNAFAEYMDQIHRESVAIKTSTDSVWSTLTTGSDAMEDTFTSVRKIRQIIGETWRTAEALNAGSERIEHIVKMIDNIASRVSILSLNAAIESTKAKKFSKPFVEVSDSIRKLSKITNTATQEVTVLLGSIQNGIFKVSKLLRSDLSRIQESESKTEQTKTMLAQIRSAIEKEDNRIRRIVQAVGEMQEASHEVGDGMNGVSFVSSKNTEAVQQVTAANNELIGNLQDVSRLAQNLEHMAQSEENLFAKLTIREKGRKSAKPA